MTNAPNPVRMGMSSVLGLILVLAAVLATVAALANNVIERETAVRSVGSLFSLLMIGAGNLLPKWSAAGSSAGAGSRLAGWLLVAGGCLSLGLWLLSPQEGRTLNASATALAFFAVALMGAVWNVRRAQAPSVAGVARHASAQQATLHVLHGLIWAFAIIMASTLFGKQPVPWMTAAFAVSLSLLQWALRPGRTDKER